MKRRRSPQEKKVLSYARDRRNAFGENDKASRKNVPLSKALRRRAYRKQVKASMRRAGAEADVGAAGVRWRSFVKEPDIALGSLLDRPPFNGRERPSSSTLRDEALRRNR